MDKIQIKRVTLNDLEQLQHIGRQTFSETFSAVNTKENMNKYLEEAFAADKLTAEINNICSLFYFAMLDNKVIAYLKVNWGESQTELKDSKALEIERIYVLKDYQRKKVGQRLYEKALQLAREINVEYVWLGVWEENHRALGFYQNNGFTAFDKHHFKLGKDVQTDIMMKQWLENVK
jgi:ribosomal protein S18 acetylase RimI-like enzyme